MTSLYPLKVAPLYRTRVWGGTLMGETLRREIPPLEGPVGEAWDIVDRADAVSTVVNGPLAGKTLRQLMETDAPGLAGPHLRGDRFPLIVKIIDAGDRLSLQVHPDDAAAARIGGGAEGKDEMWYLLAHRPGARILAGLNPRATKIQLEERLGSAEIEQLLQIYESHPHDTYFLPGGTLHAIGAGNLLLEIQQNSDTTYRISDWNRVGLDGLPRALHIEEGMHSIQFTNRSSPRIAAASDDPAHNRRLPLVTLCRHFRADELRLRTTWHDDTAPAASFHLVSAIDAPLRIRGGSGEAEAAPGETVLVPFACGKYEIEPLGAGPASAVRVTL